MADSHRFTEAFLRRVESIEIDDKLLQELCDLTPDQRSELATIFIERKTSRANGNGG